MTYKVVILDEALIDIKEANHLYKNLKSESLQSKFEIDLIQKIEYLEEFPLTLAIKYSKIRVLNLKGFPFQLHFYVEDNYVYIVGFLHGKSNPKSWRKRLK